LLLSFFFFLLVCFFAKLSKKSSAGLKNIQIRQQNSTSSFSANIIQQPRYLNNQKYDIKLSQLKNPGVRVILAGLRIRYEQSNICLSTAESETLHKDVPLLVMEPAWNTLYAYNAV
jgi:hypothetical protein